MKNTKTLTGNAAREKILKGVNAVYQVIKLTLGPENGSALMYRTYARGPRIVDDGNTIAQIIEPKDEFERLAAQAFKETSSQVNAQVGDGTTTTAVIAGKLINDIFSKMSDTALSYASASKLSVQKIKNEFLVLSKQIQEKIKEKSKKVETIEDLEKIASVSLGNSEIGKVVAKIVWEVGADGFIDVVDGYKGELETEVIKGARFPAKPGAKAFINNPKRFEMVIEDCPVFLTNYKLDNDNQIRAVFQKLLQKNSKLVIIAPDFSEQILISMVQTTKQGVFMFPVKVPSLRTEQFEDLAIYFGANFINKDTGKKLENAEESDLGFVVKLVVKETENREDAIALGGRGAYEDKMRVADREYRVSSPVAERIKILKEQINEERIESHKKLLERRIASLASAVGVIRVGASTTAESLPLKLKIEDAQYASKAALEEGYVKGGGLCLKEIAEELDKPDEVYEGKDGVRLEKISHSKELLIKALKAPYEQIQENNEEPLEIGEDIIDPTKVVRLAVEYAISVAANLITCKIIIPETEEESPADGYNKIANAIMTYTKFWARREGLIKENQTEQEKDLMRIWEENEGKD